MTENKILIIAILAASAPSVWAADTAGAEFFEFRIRPVLAKNCYACHSGDSGSPMGGLFLSSRTGMLTGGKSGPAVVPGKPSDSLLLHAIRYEGRKMPPSGQLSDAVIADFEKWIAMGAPDPRAEAKAVWKPSTVDIEKGRQYWAFQPPQKPAVPKVKNATWSPEAIDRLLLARMEKERVTPAPDADRATWIRRVTLDLIGLPPAPEEIDAFLRDRSKDAYAKVVDRLLASDRFGERWGRHWLDVARYAESVGRGRNYVFPYAWRYRNWVIDAFNQDMPYDRFVREQIAGDLLPSDSVQQHNEQLIATGFLTLGSHDLVEQNPAIFRMDVVDEQINATSRAFMGVTVGCARCHDHKFDPIPTSDYYAMAGIFRSTEMLSGLQRRPRDNASYFNVSLLAKLNYAPGEPQPDFLPDPAKHQRWEELQQEITELQQNPRKAMAKLAAQTPGATAKSKAAANQALGQKLRTQAQQILNQLDQFPLPQDLVMAVRESSSPADCEVHIHGDVKDLGPTVPRGFPQVVSQPGEKAQIGPKESGRLELAQWLTRRDNPTTARVAVNRIWEHLFGRGIVATVDNFGAMGEKPSNQELLDYLAVRFMDQGWSTKKMVREIVLSRAYRLSSADNERNDNIDPGNVLLWRANRRRLEVEAIRDSLLLISGRLDLKPPVESPVMEFRRGRSIDGKGGRGKTAPDDYSVSMLCRTVYVPVVRNFLPEMFETFDFPEPSETKGVRDVTTVPTQALFMMNSKFAIEQSRFAANKLLSNPALTPQARVTRAYREVLGRTPTAPELARSLEFVKASDAVAWEHLYQALFASAEFRYRS